MFITLVCIVSTLVASHIRKVELKNRIRNAGASIDDTISGQRIIVGPYMNFALSFMDENEDSSFSNEQLIEVVELAAQLGNVTEFSIYQTDITDDGILDLPKLRDLQEIVIVDSKITNAGLLNLRQMDGLKKLTIIDCPNISSKGISALRRALPECLLERETGRTQNEKQGQVQISENNK